MSLAFDEYGRPFLIIKVRCFDRPRRFLSLSRKKARVLLLASFCSFRIGWFFINTLSLSLFYMITGTKL